MRNANTKTFLSVVAATGALALLAGCGGGTLRTPQYELSPTILTGGNRVAATETFDFSGAIRNSNFTTPRFFIQTPVDEPLYNPANPIGADNVLHGTIDENTGRYTAPARLADTANRTGNNDSDLVVVLDRGTAEELRTVRDNALRAGYQKWQMTGFATDSTTAGVVRQTMIDFGVLGDPDTVGFALATRKNPRYPDYNSYVAGAKTGDVLWQCLTTFREKVLDTNNSLIAANGVNFREEVLRRMIAALDAGVRLPLTGDVDAEKRTADTPIADLTRTRKTTVRLDLLHKVDANPLTIDVSIRDAVRLDQFIKILGDQDMCASTVGANACRTLSNADLGKRVTFSIENPTQGAGGALNNDTGLYTAPLTLSKTVTGRGTQDIIRVTSLADPSVSAAITINVVVADAPTTITITDGTTPRPSPSPTPAGGK